MGEKTEKAAVAINPAGQRGPGAGQPVPVVPGGPHARGLLVRRPGRHLGYRLPAAAVARHDPRARRGRHRARRPAGRRRHARRHRRPGHLDRQRAVL